MGVIANSVNFRSVTIGNDNGPVDPYFANVALLLHCDGSNGSTLLTDSSSYGVNKNLTVNSTISTADSVFGGSSINYTKQEYGLNGNNWAGSQFSRASGQAYTIEFWWKHVSSSYASTAAPYLLSFKDSGSANIFSISKYSTGNQYSFRLGTNPSVELAMTTNQWNFFAMTIDASNIFNLWLGGSSVYSTTFNPITGGNGIFELGFGDGTSTNGLSAALGYIDEIRVTQGVARYTSTFTPPSAPFPNL